MKVLFVWPNKDSFGFKPIGISLLSGTARREGWETALFDTSGIDFGFQDNSSAQTSVRVFKPVDMGKFWPAKKKTNLGEEFEREFRRHNPDCLALSVLSDEFKIAGEISKKTREISPGTPIIWGGKYPTLNPEKTLEEFGADFVCVGEGLDAFREFLRALEGKRDPYDIPSIWGRKKDGTIVRNKLAELHGNLGDLPHVDWDIFSEPQFYKPFDGKAYRSGDHMLNWGCPYHCTYCINDFYHKLYNNRYDIRRYEPERIVGELKELKNKHRLEFFKFHDEDFLMRPLDNLREISKLYKAEINLPFVIETNPKSVTDKKVELLKEMNCVSASLAVETGNAKIRKEVLRRVDSEEDIVRGFSLMKEAGIRTSAFIMFGLPYESRETYEDTVRLLRKAEVQYPGGHFFYPFEGTELRRISIEEGFFNPEDAETDVFKREFPPLKFKNLTRGELVRMRGAFVLYVKLPECYEKHIRRSEKEDTVGTTLRNKLVGIFENTVWKNDGWHKDDGRQEEYLAELERIHAGGSQ